MGKKVSAFIWIVSILLVWSGFALNGMALTEEEKSDGFVSLFDGTDLSGWKITGNKEAFGIEDGALTCYGTGGNRIQTLKKYENFILRLEFKISKNGNNGIYIHCPDHGRESRVGGEIQVKDDYGKKLVADTCGSLYDVFAPSVNACKPHTEWQSYEITFIWPRLHVVLNGTTVLDKDVTTHERSKYRTKFGYIAIQDHQDRVWYRNIRIKDLGGDDESLWIPLLNGDTLAGWHAIGETDFEINDGVLTVRKGDGYLINTNRYENFELWTYVKTDRRTENGIYYRWRGTAEPGYRVTQANDDDLDEYTGSITGLVPANQKHVGNDYWYPVQIICQGGETVVVVNGRVAAKYKQTKEANGSIALDMLTAGRKNAKIQFQGMRIKPL